jgi:hypothetical protein
MVGVTIADVSSVAFEGGVLVAEINGVTGAHAERRSRIESRTVQLLRMFIV